MFQFDSIVVFISVNGYTKLRRWFVTLVFQPVECMTSHRPATCETSDDLARCSDLCDGIGCEFGDCDVSCRCRCRVQNGHGLFTAAGMWLSQRQI